ncbi:MAG TPA: peptidase C26 [Desulfotomaculum sp.]|nr:peptidase C26 [Desulfotomaculum sp.]
MPPVIGITCSWDDVSQRHFLGSLYCEAVRAAGGVPVLLANYEKEEEIAELLGIIDGLLLSGGKDVDPFYFGEETLPECGEITPLRDAFEIKLARMAIKGQIPVLGICRGAQVLNIAAGGNIYQDIKTQLTCCLKHYQQAPGWAATHRINIEKDSLLESILQVSEIMVNSYHHQAVRDVAPGFKISAKSSDGVVEAIEGASGSFILGLQCHPEEMWERDTRFLKLFQALTNCALK